MSEQRVSTGYVPRPWQARVHASLRRFSVLVIHRRGGKTVLAVNALIDAALRCQRPMGRFGYVAPYLKQARQIAWEYLKHYTRSIPGVEYHEQLLQVRLPNGASIQLFGADNPDALRGLYFDGVVLDEVADMRPEVWGSIIRPALADRAGWALFIGTPRGVNLFSELYHKALADPAWYADLLTCYDTRSLPADEIERSKREMTEAQFAQELLCDFHAAADDALVKLTDAIEATRRAPRITDYSWAPRVLGVDVARYGGDESVLFPRQGVAGFEPIVLRGMDTMQVSERVTYKSREWSPRAVFVDVGGIGAGVFDRLLQLGVPAIAVDFGSRAAEERFENKRAEMWWEMAEWIRTGGAIPEDTDLLRDLTAPRFSYANKRGRMALESKDDMRARGIPSPDRGDALALTFAMPVAPLDQLDALSVGDGRCVTNDTAWRV